MSDPIAAFWAWWPSARPRLEKSIASGDFGRLPEEIAERVHAISAELDWELGKGSEAAHAFCLSAKGDPVARRLAERWLRAAPPKDATWEFHPARQPHPPGMALEIFGHRIVEDDLRVAFEVETGRERVDVGVWHPSFKTLGDQAATVAFLVLDGAFGEDGVERWLGAIETPAEMPPEAVPFSSLRESVTDLAAVATGESFALLEGHDQDGRPMMALINQALKRIDHLDLDMFVAVRLLFQHPNEHGFPEAAESETVNTMEDELIAALGDSAAYYGRVTCAGARIFHFFARESSPAGPAIDGWISRHPTYRIQATWQQDPRWDALHMFG
jgi:hypothetical protein